MTGAEPGHQSSVMQSGMYINIGMLPVVISDLCRIPEILLLQLEQLFNQGEHTSLK